MYQVLACGSNGNYQLGQDDDEDQRALRPCLFHVEGEPQPTTSIQHKPRKIACGGNHTLILFENGDVFSCGDNEFGQTGHPESESVVAAFKRVTSIQHKFIDISCGWDYSFLLTEGNDLFACGKGLKGELGLGIHVLQATKPHLVTRFDAGVRKLKTAVNHTIVQTSNNKLYGWGNCRKGQLGNIEGSLIKKGAIWQPTELDFEISPIVTFELGREFTVLSSSDGLHLFGKSNTDVQELRREAANAELIDAMWSSIHFKSHHTIKSFGTNTHGQLYDYGSISGDFEFVVGSEHGLLKSENKVYAWGWGEHGNCGDVKNNNTAIGLSSSIDDATDDGLRSITFNYLNVLYDGSEEVIMIAGGCATSWVAIYT
ncbi:ATS1 [Candida margitis]|uniref:ATS1 n=1 Tax=Candida margitis TaxID=1775924 RepID=UPI002225E7A2|nr:ATS1 [Candida margitis]KAI5969573.1 ATS1 [Candida margitis]